MRVRNNKNKKEILNNCELLIKSPFLYQGKYQEIFGNNNPINIEIGMGKGNFIYNMALSNPDINFIGIEKNDTIMASAIKNIKTLPNLRLIIIDANEIDKVFRKEINLIYLNFVDPWPKKRHAKRRLTYESFLKKYDLIFKNTKRIKLKTDNELLFESSIISLNNYGYKIIDISLDLINSHILNVKTEYEEKFIKQNVKIKYLEAVKK